MGWLKCFLHTYFRWLVRMRTFYLQIQEDQEDNLYKVLPEGFVRLGRTGRPRRQLIQRFAWRLCQVGKDRKTKKTTYTKFCLKALSGWEGQEDQEDNLYNVFAWRLCQVGKDRKTKKTTYTTFCLKALSGWEGQEDQEDDLYNVLPEGFVRLGRTGRPRRQLIQRFAWRLCQVGKDRKTKKTTYTTFCLKALSGWEGQEDQEDNLYNVLPEGFVRLGRTGRPRRQLIQRFAWRLCQVGKNRKTKKTTYITFHLKDLSGREGLPNLTKPSGKTLYMLSSWSSCICEYKKSYFHQLQAPMGSIHQKFARKKVGDTEKRAKHWVHCACSEMNVVRSFDRKFFLCLDFKGSW